MRSLRTALALLYVVVGGMTLVNEYVLLRFRSQSNYPPPHFSLPVLLADLFLPVTGCLFLIAAIGYWWKWRSGRMWCLTLGAVNLIIPFLLAWFFSYHRYGSASSTLSSNGLLLGLGALTLFAFWRWDPASETKVRDAAASSARSGDGTLTLLNRTHILLEFAGFFAIWTAWLHRASLTGLPNPPFRNGLLQLALAELAVITAHEAGHALSGIALGQKVRAFIVGPFQWQHLQGRWKFSLNPAALLLTGGATAVVPQRLREPRSRELTILAAGPLVSLVTGGIALWAAFRAQGAFWHLHWFLIAMFGSISLLTAFVNCIPLRTGGGYSDGARILQILRGGEWAELQEAFRVAMATTVTPLRPRDYDLETLHRIMASRIVTGLQQFFLCLLAHSCCVDRGLTQQSRLEMKEAEKVYDLGEAEIPGGLLLSFVVDEALFAHDAARARLWWDRMEAKKPRRITADYWMAKSALSWAERNRAEASACWEKADAFLRTMPRTGTYAFDRDRLAELKNAIATEPAMRASLAPA
ncbi:MAG TPA: M50 family metallopeptidase [Acidobacteriaceae bacterium]|nr:M50 family metallopeptidase [Acidobacteriaceae bacterium]